MVNAQPNLAFDLVSQVINNARGLSSSSSSNNNSNNNTNNNNKKQTQRGPFSFCFWGSLLERKMSQIMSCLNGIDFYFLSDLMFSSVSAKCLYLRSSVRNAAIICGVTFSSRRNAPLMVSETNAKNMSARTCLLPPRT